MDYGLFKAYFLNLTGIDLNLYKEKQMKRRIENYLSWFKTGDYELFCKSLENNPVQLNHFMDYITINVTEFFRTPEQWKQMKDEVLPQLQSFNVWSSACSTGEEAYSIAMSLAELTSVDNIHVLATDIDDRVLGIATEGKYNDHALNAVPASYRYKYFDTCQNGYRVRDEIRKCVEFRKLNLLADEYPQGMDLILCRNVLIYFTDEAKSHVYSSFKKSLKPGGFLFTGHTEQILYPKDFGFEKINKSIYRVPVGH